MPEIDTVICVCPKCGRQIERPAEKVGVLFQCGQCGKILKTPSIASQQQATASQLGLIARAIRVSCWANYAAIATGIAIGLGFVMAYQARSGYRDSAFMILPFSALMIFAAVTNFALLFTGSKIFTCVGYGRGSFLIWYFLCWPAWLTVMVISGLRLRTSLRRLARLGPRPQKQSAISAGT